MSGTMYRTTSQWGFQEAPSPGFVRDKYIMWKRYRRSGMLSNYHMRWKVEESCGCRKYLWRKLRLIIDWVMRKYKSLIRNLGYTLNNTSKSVFEGLNLPLYVVVLVVTWVHQLVSYFLH